MSTPEASPVDVHLVLLAGGKSSRMGREKLTLSSADGSLLVGQWLAGLQWDGPTAIVLPPGGAVPAGLTVDHVVFDAVEGEGPLRGVLSAMDRLVGDWLVFVPVDMPGITRAQIDWLLSARVTHPNGRVFLTRRIVEGEAVIEPLPLLLHRSMRGTIENRLAEGRRSLHGLSHEADAVLLDAPKEWPETLWQNLNRPADLEAYLAAASTAAARATPRPTDTSR